MELRRDRNHLGADQLKQAPRVSISAPLLSFLWPGLGQFYVGYRRRAALHAIPPLVLLLAFVFVLLTAPQTFALRLFAPSYALGVVIFIVADAAWRVLSIVDAWLTTRDRRHSANRAAALVVFLSLIVIASHLLAAYWVQTYSEGGRPIFSGGPPPPAPAQSLAPSGQPTAIPSRDPLDDLVEEEPLPTNQLGAALDPGPGIPADGPLTILFVGLDSGFNRDHALTDVLMVGAFDRATNEMALLNIPRDTGRFPLYGGGTYDNRINSFLNHARRNPELFPEGPIRALTNEMAFLVGIPIHYYAVVNMEGFASLVDMVGGVDVTIDYEIADPVRKLYLQPGRHHLDGGDALAFVRSRYGPNNNDYRRGQRQQQVIRALAERVRDPRVVVRLPELSREAARFARTNIPTDSLEQFLDVLDGVQDATPTRVVFQPRDYARRIPPDEVGGRFMTELKLDAVAALSIELFGEHSLYYEPGLTPLPPDGASPAAP